MEVTPRSGVAAEAAARPGRSSGDVAPVHGQTPSREFTRGFPHDPDFPQLAVATDPARMLEVFRTHLAPAPGRQVEIEACIPFRFRCRQSTPRCVLQYTLRLVEHVDGEERRWEQSVTGVVYAGAGAGDGDGDGEAERQWRERLGAAPRREIPAQWLAFG